MKIHFDRLTFYTFFSFLIVVIISTWLLLSAYLTDGQSEDEIDIPPNEVRLVYVEWASEIASTNVVRVLLEKLGFEVELLSVSAAAMWQSVASGDADGHVAAWLPTTHSHYYNALKDKVENLGPNLEGTEIGLVVPNYVTIDSIEALNAHADQFKGKIIGIDPGAGLMSKTETVIEQYNLKPFKLIEGSGATMTAALADAMRTQQWIVVTGWTPHWKFARWQLKYLKDSKGIYGEKEYIGTIVRKGLKEEMPAVYHVLDQFSWTAAEMAELMIMNQEKDNTPYENAKKWLNKNPERLEQFLNIPNNPPQ
jgi:glycine betaine/proline transport system substrate-binding protein